MSMHPFKVIFLLDGSGIYYDPSEPIMLDGILAAACVRHHRHGEPPARDEPCDDVPLPLSRWHMNGAWGWKASALFPSAHASAVRVDYWRKRFRQDRIEFTNGSPNLTNGIYRDWNMPLQLILTQSMIAYGHGDSREVRRELKRSIRFLGKKRSHGHGLVINIEIERTEKDWSMHRDGNPMRWLPDDRGTKLIRVRPPYWNIIDRHNCQQIEPFAECRTNELGTG